MHSFIPRPLRRLPVFWWLGVIAVASTAGLTVAGAVTKAQESAERFEGLIPVYVTIAAVEPGELIEETHVRQISWPRSFLPDAPIADDPVGKSAHVALVAGEPLTMNKLTAGAGGKTAAQLRLGERGVAVPLGEASPRMETGDYIDLLATVQMESDGFAPTSVVASAARVLHVGESAVTVAVAETEAPRVAFALAQGALVPVLTVP